jgi:hypothetical protein
MVACYASGLPRGFPLKFSSASALIAFASLVLSIGCTADADDVTSTELDVPTPSAQLAPSKRPACDLGCATPAEGCHYENAVTTGPCRKQTCGDLVCVPVCWIQCAAPPDGCHYENAYYGPDCTRVTCGSLVCAP